MTMTDPTTSATGPSAAEIERVTQALADAGRQLGAVLRGAALIREEAESIDLDETAADALDELTRQQRAVSDVVELIGGENGANGLRLMDHVAELGKGHAADGAPVVQVQAFEYPASLPGELDDLIARLQAKAEELRPLMAETWHMWRTLDKVGDQLQDRGVSDIEPFYEMADSAGLRISALNEVGILLDNLVESPGSFNPERMALIGVERPTD